MTENAVQQYLERSVHEVKALVETGLFSADEVRALVTQRRNFEYGVKSHGATKATWLRYIEYELSVDKLRRMRAQRLRVKRQDSQEANSLRRIHGLFMRMTRRFRGELDLWLQWVQFAKECGSTNVLSRSIGSAVLLFPLVADLWILAADWEFSNDCNMVAARSLMLRGIRSNPQSTKLWLEYFRLELMYLAKIRARLDLVKHKEQEDKVVVNIDDDEADLDSEDGDSVGQLALDQTAREEPKLDPGMAIPITDSSFFKGAIPVAIFQSATEKFPNDFDFWSSFVPLAKSLDGPAELLLALREALFAQFSHSLEYWQFRLSEANENGEKARDIVALAQQHLSATAWWELQVFACGTEATKVARTCALASEAKAATAPLTSVWISALLQTEQACEAVRVGAEAVNAWPANGPIWFDYLTALLSEAATVGGAGDKKTRKTVSKSFERALKQVPESDEKVGFIQSLFVRYLLSLPQPSESAVLSAVGNDVACAEYVLDVAPRVWPQNDEEEGDGGESPLRQLCASLLDQCPALSVFRRVIAMETHEELKRALFEDCVDRFGATSAAVWIDFAQFETECGRLDEAGKLHWRAKKTLQGKHLTEYIESI